MRAARWVALFLLAASIQAPRYDLLLLGGRIVDGSGRPPFSSDIAIANGRIAAIGRIPRERAAAVASVRGLTVAPGFIATRGRAAGDCSNGAPASLGITTIVLGGAGVSAADVGLSLARIREARPIVNCATLIGHQTVHAAVMGDASGLPTPSQLARMKSLVWKGMADGALGLSSGAGDAPAAPAVFAEMVELARVAATTDGVYAAAPAPGPAFDGTLDVLLRIGDATGGRIQVSGLESIAAVRVPDLLRKIRRARTDGVDVRGDVDPATADAAAFVDPNVMFAGDPTTGYSYAALARTVRNRSALSIQEVVRKLTALPAAQYRLTGRGEISVGAAADLVVFDAARLGESGGPSSAATRMVFVNGVAVIADGAQTDARPGLTIANSLLLPRDRQPGGSLFVGRDEIHRDWREHQ